MMVGRSEAANTWLVPRDLVAAAREAEAAAERSLYKVVHSK
jgi:hypothetical protein